MSKKITDKVTKFKNGKIVLYPNKECSIDTYYNDTLFWRDLYFNQINGYMYLVDYNQSNMYDLSLYGYNVMVSILEWLESELKNGKMVLYPVPKKEAKSLFEDLENGY